MVGHMHAVLAAWFRLKYPQVAIGALASSSPILNFENLTSPYSFNNIVTHDFRVWILSLCVSLSVYLSISFINLFSICVRPWLEDIEDKI